MKRNFILTILTFTIAGFGFSQIPPANISNGINSLFQGHVNQTLGLVSGHVIRIEKPGSWIYENSAGFASISPATNAQANMKFKVASITKIFTTVAIFKLIQNGQVNLNAPISSYLPLSVVQGFDNYQNIKIKNLLNHTSGIKDPQNEFQGRLNYWIYMKRFEDIPIDSLITWSYASPFGVGNYSYSNSNFYLLAEIIKSVSGGSYKDYVTKNIINPLGLTNTDFNTIPAGSFMRGYLKGSFYGSDIVLPQNIGLKPDSLYDFTEASNSWGYGAADIWSNTTDLIMFHKALFSGQLINAKWLDTMKAVVTITGDMGSYGHGMIQFNSFNNGPIYGFGHTGTAFGYGSMLCYIPSLDVYICSAGNYMKIGQEFLQRDIYNFLNNNKTSITETDLNNSVSIYPNPTSNILNVNTTLQNFQVSVSDVTGQLIFDKKNSYTIDVSELPTGLYVFRLEDLNSMTTITKKFIRE
jgi:CubicO group peptidase (beta-lactamase class C family)